jgi:two-component system nitrate/nitrite sensor histidine kinase NarX
LKPQAINETSSPSESWSKESLNFLYKISCAINATENSSALLSELLKLVTNKVGGFSAIVRLISEEDWMDLYASYGVNEQQLEKLQRTPIDGSLFSYENHAIKEIRLTADSPLIRTKNTSMISVPVRHQIHTLGVLNVFVEQEQISIDDETALMLLAIGQHIGLVIEKNRLNDVARQKLIQEERNMIANELHDSLAQTLASLRFQVRILDETLQPTSEYMAIMGIEQVENSLDEAYTDLRELIAHCRVPAEKQGLIPSIERVVNKFREETGIHILLQCERQVVDIPATMEMNVYRIVQEALTNIKKHASAHIVRVLLDCDENGKFRILVEDDGKGFDKDAIQSKDGQHIGLTIMKERARNLGGNLKVESDPEEGTRVELKFQYLRKQDS